MGGSQLNDWSLHLYLQNKREKHFERTWGEFYVSNDDKWRCFSVATVHQLLQLIISLVKTVCFEMNSEVQLPVLVSNKLDDKMCLCAKLDCNQASSFY